MTPSARKPVASHAPFLFPTTVDVVDGTLLAWEGASDDGDVTFRGGQGLLPAFLDLATAEPDEMGVFLTSYGIPGANMACRTATARDGSTAHWTTSTTAGPM